MVPGGDHGIVVGNDHFFITNDRANRRARWQADVLDGLANHLAGLGVAMGNRLDCLRRTSTQ
ncbi:hypothetical protein D3C73_1433890 [compost metagenome]